MKKNLKPESKSHGFEDWNPEHDDGKTFEMEDTASK
jgi:hypothetical protein